VPSATGNLVKIEMALFCASGSGTDQPSPALTAGATDAYTPRPATNRTRTDAAAVILLSEQARGSFKTL
jgi:hypothetical protein